jgi:drug/metabolite transporter (DMT)-like permease
VPACGEAHRRTQSDDPPVLSSRATEPGHGRPHRRYPVGIALGLGAALSWGLADYFAALASRSYGELRVVLGFHLAAMIPLTVLVLATGALAHVRLGQLPVFVLIGAVGWTSYLAFYGALAIGPISVLSPIVSGYAAVTVLLAVVVVGERWSAGQTAAVIVIILGAMVASADVRQVVRAKFERRSVLGFALALCAMVLLGAFVFGVSYYRSRIGWLGPIFLARGFSAVFLLAHLAAARDPRPERRPPRVLLLVVLLAVLDTGGYVFFNVGVGHAETAIVAAASAPYAVVPILMGVLLLHERPTAVQWLGVLLVIAGVTVLAAAS